MRFLEMALAFAALGFVLANVAFSVFTVWLWRVMRTSEYGSASLFALRMLPSIGSFALVLGLVLPAFLVFEPRGTTERAGPVLIAFVLVAVVLLAAGMRRALAGWVETRRLERHWKSAAEGVASAGGPFVAYRVPSAQPLAALVGVVRPRLYVSDRFLDALSPKEWQAVLDHEAGHMLSFDNLRRALMRWAPDALAFTRAGREIERAWAAAAEEEADDRAAARDRARSLDLAGALLKASRMAPLRFAEFSNFCDDATIAHRVERLLSEAAAPPPGRRTSAALSAGLIALGLVAAALAGPGLRGAYALTEGAVRLLQ